VLNRIGNQDFLFIAPDASNFTFKIEKIVLRVRKVKLVSEFVESIEHMLSKQEERITYPLRDVRVFTKTYAGYGTELIEDNLFHGVLPDRVVFGIVDNDAFNGSKTKNPFNFKHKSISEIALVVNGLPYPINPLSIDFTNDSYHNAYHLMLESLQCTGSNSGNALCLSKKDFKNGFTLFSFDMSADQYGGMNHISLYNAPANVQLRLRFTASNANDIITLIVYYEMSSRMVIDASRRVQVFSK
jgi:hypothetical protein